MADDIERANRDIIRHNIEMSKQEKGRYQTNFGPRRRGSKKKNKNKNKNKNKDKNKYKNQKKNKGEQ